MNPSLITNFRDFCAQRLEVLKTEIRSLSLYKQILDEQLANPQDWTVLQPEMVESLAVLNSMSVVEVEEALDAGSAYPLILRALKNFKEHFPSYVSKELSNRFYFDDLELLKTFLAEAEEELAELLKSNQPNKIQAAKLKAEIDYLKQRIAQ